MMDLGYLFMGGFGWSWIMMIVFWILVMAGTFAFMGCKENKSKHDRSSARSPINTLKGRYAKSGISRQESE